MKASVILNGHLDTDHLVKDLDSNSKIYVLDGAYNYVSNLNIDIHKVLGDLDSIEEVPKSVDILKLEDQNYTDFEKSLEYLSKKYTDIDVYGGGGKEQDHFFGNLHAAKKYMNYLNIVFHDEFQSYFLINGNQDIKCNPSKIFSIIPFYEMNNVSTTGLKYPLKNQDLIFGKFISVRNQTIDSNVSIRSSNGCGIVFVER